MLVLRNQQNIKIVHTLTHGHTLTHTHTYNSDAGTNAHTFVDVGNDDQEGAILRRSTRESHRPDHYGVWVYTTSKEPTTVR